MKCPLREVPKFDNEGEAHFEQADCLKEECAWWDSNLECCFLVSLYTATRVIGGSLVDIVKKLTMLRPPAR